MPTKHLLIIQADGTRLLGGLPLPLSDNDDKKDLRKLVVLFCKRKSYVTDCDLDCIFWSPSVRVVSSGAFGWDCKKIEDWCMLKCRKIPFEKVRCIICVDSAVRGMNLAPGKVVVKRL